MKLPKKIIVGFVVIFLTLAFNGVFAYRSILALYHNSKQMAANREISRITRTLLSSLTDAETGQRGYLLTGQELYLEPYHRALRDIPRHLQNLAGLTAPMPEQNARVALLAAKIPRTMDELKRAITAYRTQGFTVAQQSVNTNEGKQGMDELRQIMQAIDRPAQQNIELWEQQLEISRNNLRLGIVIASLLALGLLLAVSGVFYRLMRQQNAVNQLLEGRVQERTRQLAQSNDDLQTEVEERQRAGELLQESNRDLARSNEALQDFAYVASHDLQEPLRKIQTFSNRLTTKHAAALDEEARDYLNRMDRAARRMEALIRDLFAYSRVTTQARPFQEVDLDEITQGVLSDLEDLVARVNGRVEVFPLAAIEADPVQMRQLLQNLLANALKFHRADTPPLVTLRGEFISEDDAPLFRFTIADNGIGFAEKYLDKIFQPFQRLNPQYAYEGTGIGLALCRKIVERHGGTLTARSQPEQGASFIVTLPVKQNSGELINA